jgi:hypothetical protein
MNKSAEVTNKIVEQLYFNESEIFKNETKQCLDENVRNIEMHFNDDPERMIKFAESIAVYFQLKFQGNSGQTLASLVETREQVICFPKGERAVNGFNAFNQVMKYGMYPTVLFSPSY